MLTEAREDRMTYGAKRTYRNQIQISMPRDERVTRNVCVSHGRLALELNVIGERGVEQLGSRLERAIGAQG